MADLNPNIRKRARGEGERETSRQGRRLFSGTPFAMRRGRAARPISRRIPSSSCHETCFHSCHETSSIGSTVPLLCPDRSLPLHRYTGIQNVVPIDGAIRLSQAADDVPNPVGDRPGGRLCDVIPPDSHPQIPRPDLLTPLNPLHHQTNELRMGVPTTEGEHYRQPPFKPEPIVVIALDGELDGISCHQSFRTPPRGSRGDATGPGGGVEAT